jgi:MFS family permease
MSDAMRFLPEGPTMMTRQPASAAPTPAEQPVPWPTWRLAMVIVFGAFMSGLDASVVNVGLDTIARDLSASLADAQWVANAYLLALGVSLPACAWLGRRGRGGKTVAVRPRGLHRRFGVVGTGN